MQCTQMKRIYREVDELGSSLDERAKVIQYRGVEQLGSSLGERAKTIEYRFCEVRPHEARSI